MNRTSRRHFAKLCSAAAALPLAAPLAGGIANAAPQSAPAAAPQPIPPLAAAFAAIVRAQHGEHLTAEQLATIEGDFRDFVPYLERMRTAPLVNSDEPDITFSAIPEAQRCTK